MTLGVSQWALDDVMAYAGFSDENIEEYNARLEQEGLDIFPPLEEGATE